MSVRRPSERSVPWSAELDDLLAALYLRNAPRSIHRLDAAHRYISVSPAVKLLLRARELGISQGALAERLSNPKAEVRVTEDDLTSAYHRIDQVLQAQQEPRIPRAMWLRGTLLPAGWVGPLARRLGWAYRRVSVGILLALTALALFGVAVTPLPHMSLSSWLVAYAVFLFSVLVHEFGHASACSRMGARPAAIGVAAYLFLPTFYSDVTDAWTLPNRKRVVVDLAGCYLQLALAGCVYLGYVSTHSAGLMAADAMIAGTCVFSLNPFLRFDGYWVLSDLLDIPNLSAVALAAISPRRSAPRALKGRRLAVRLTVYGYGALTVVFFAAALAAVVLVGSRSSSLLAVFDDHRKGGTPIRQLLVLLSLWVTSAVLLWRLVITPLRRSFGLRASRIGGSSP